ncbi:acylphosphatase [Desulfosarcina sp. OttesenSCG-928-G10]|nr:acylphosphatase [Desulfosarcina sp. OttesenSCG-928-G10]
MANTRARLMISGHVQGVFFRAETRNTAIRLGVFGWVRNTSDGAVEAVAEGPEAAVHAWIDWCRTGPPRARVDSVDVSFQAYQGEFDAFTIRY